MARAVSFDQILFDECIYAFRSRQERSNSSEEVTSKSFLLTSFKINKKWDLGICIVYPSQKHLLPGGYAAFVSEVKNPSWIDHSNPHLFGVALSTIISFFTLEPCKSTRSSFLSRKENLSEEDIQQLLLQNPMLIMGPGSVKFRWSDEFLDSTEINLRNFIQFLYDIDYDTYLDVIQSLRLIHLSILNKRDDFGLSFHLIVSAIEAIAQIAISKDSVKVENPLLIGWEKKASNDDLFDKLLKEYKSAINNNQYITKRYVQFILNYAPSNQWEKIIPSEKQYLADTIRHLFPPEYIENLTKMPKYDFHPDELKQQEIKKILIDSYNYRSKFVHTGKQPPHSYANPLITRFFEVYFDFKKDIPKLKLLPNYELMIGIAKHSILNWLGFQFEESIEVKYKPKTVNLNVDKFLSIEKELSEIHGPFNLFMIYLDEDEEDRWNVMVASPWLKDEEKSVRIITRKMNEHLAYEDGKYIKNIVIIDNKAPEVEAIQRTIKQEHAKAEVENCSFFGFHIEHGFIITSQK